MTRLPGCIAVLLVGASMSGCASAPGGRAAADPDAPRVLVVAATADVHGRLRGWDYFAASAESHYGLARAASVVDSLRELHRGRVLLLDAGDFLQGTPLADRSAAAGDGRSPVVAAMNAMQYDAAAIGEDDFEQGIAHLERAARHAAFPLLAANARRADGSRAFPAWTIIEREGVRVGIVGATLPGSRSPDPDDAAGRMLIGDAVTAIRLAVDSLRAFGVHLVIVAAHAGARREGGGQRVRDPGSGGPSASLAGEIARGVPGVDLLVVGHSHEEAAGVLIDDVMLMYPGAWARSVAVAEITLRRVAGEWAVVGRHSMTVSVDGRAESPEVLAATEAAHRETLRHVTSPIASTLVAWRGDSARVIDTPLIDLILEVQRKATGADLASTAAVSLEARLGPGAITVMDVARLYPADHTLRAIRVTGRQLREYLEHSARYFRDLGVPGGPVDATIAGRDFEMVSGIAYTIDITQPVGRRITRLVRGARSVADTDTFTMALSSYRQAGGGGYAMVRGAPVVYDEGQEIRQLLIDELERRGTIAHQDYFTPNWRLEPERATDAAYRAMHGSRPPTESDVPENRRP